MKKKKNEIDEQIKAASKKFHDLVGEMLDADIRPEFITAALAQELTCAVAAIASLKEDKTPEEKHAFVTDFFKMLTNLTLKSVKNYEVLKEADHGDN